MNEPWAFIGGRENTTPPGEGPVKGYAVKGKKDRFMHSIEAELRSPVKDRAQRARRRGPPPIPTNYVQKIEDHIGAMVGFVGKVPRLFKYVSGVSGRTSKESA